MSSQSDEHSLMGKKSALDSPLDINADYIGGESSWILKDKSGRGYTLIILNFLLFST
jgi:hypothetical protein